MSDPREAVSSVEFYSLRRKLWIEAVCALLSKPSHPQGLSHTPETAAIEADAVVAQFDKRFRSVY